MSRVISIRVDDDVAAKLEAFLESKGLSKREWLEDLVRSGGLYKPVQKPEFAYNIHSRQGVLK